MAKEEYFVLGFIAGEGSFTVQISKQDDWYNIVPTFQINLNRRELQTAKQICDILPVDATIYEQSSSVKVYCGGKRNTRKVIEWIEDKDSTLFEASDKHDSMLAIKRILQILESGRHMEREGLIELMEIRDTMNGEGHVNKKSADDIRAELE